MRMLDVPLLRGAQVGVDVQLGAEAQHALLRTDLGGVELGVADRAFEDAAADALQAASVSSGRGVARVPDRLRPERVLFELEVGGDLLESAKRLPHHLGADPVAWQDYNCTVSTPSRSST